MPAPFVVPFAVKCIIAGVVALIALVAACQATPSVKKITPQQQPASENSHRHEGGGAGGHDGGLRQRRPEHDVNGRECAVCFEELHRSFVLVPCGHAAFCGTCAQALTTKRTTCPLCRTPIISVVTLHL